MSRDEIAAAIASAEILYAPSYPQKPPGGGKKPPRVRGRPPGGMPPRDDGRVAIKRQGNQLNRETRQAIAALAAEPPLLFKFGDSIVAPCIVELKTTDGAITHSAALKEASEPVVRAFLGERTRWFRFDRRLNDWADINPPKEIAEQIIGNPSAAELPCVSGVVISPTLRPDGSLIDKPGYDSRTGLFSMAKTPMQMAAIANQPSLEEATEALEDLNHLLSGFPFVEEHDRAVGLSMLLTLALRPAFDVVPCHAISAPTIGAGKTMLVNLASVVSSGQLAGVIAANSDFREVEKAIVGAMKEAIPVIFLDNLTAPLDSAFVGQCIEQPIVRLRMLGGSPTFACVNTSAFCATGNALVIGKDMIRRVIVSKLDPRVEQPEFREHAFNPIETVLADPPRYLRSCLLIARFGMQAPDHGKPELGSFGRWDRCVRRALITLGCADPCAAMQSIRDDDPGLNALFRVQHCLKDAFGNTFFTSIDIFATVQENQLNSFSWEATALSASVKTALREALMEVAESRGAISQKRLGWYLRRNIDRIVNGLVIEKAGLDGHHELQKYRIASR